MYWYPAYSTLQPSYVIRACRKISLYGRFSNSMQSSIEGSRHKQKVEWSQHPVEEYLKCRHPRHDTRASISNLGHVTPHYFPLSKQNKLMFSPPRSRSSQEPSHWVRYPLWLSRAYASHSCLLLPNLSAHQLRMLWCLDRGDFVPNSLETTFRACRLFR